MTKKQNHVLEVLRKMVARNRYFPTVRELGREANLSSPATVHAYLRRLAGQGHLVRRGGAWRLAAEGLAVPLVGFVPAGSPLEMFESLGEEVDLPSWMAESRERLMALRVRGDSMKDAYIRDGDLVLIRQEPRAETGEMVVARLADGSITLKRLRSGPEGPFLVPENPDYAPIRSPFQVVGKVVGVLRRYR